MRDLSFLLKAPIRIFSATFCMVFLVNFASSPALAGESSPTDILAARQCTSGWNMEGKASVYNQDTLFEKINGESELFFPYGFEVLASARYVNEKSPQIAIEADVYTMGSRLDSFGIYANFRKVDAKTVKVGTEGFVSASQLLFYQDRYFVRLQVSGALSLEQEILLDCARSISVKLPPASEQPEELRAFMVPGIVKGSERYIAQSLLGYSFFRRGFTADALLDDEQVRVFIIPGESPASAKTAFENYSAYLKESGQEVSFTETDGRLSLTAADPLYQKACVELTGRYIIGIVKVKNIPAAQQLIGEMRKILAGAPHR